MLFTWENRLPLAIVHLFAWKGARLGSFPLSFHDAGLLGGVRAKSELKICPARITTCQSIGTIGLRAFGADPVESALGHERSTAFEAFSFDSWLFVCQGTTAVISVIGQEYPPS